MSAPDRRLRWEGEPVQRVGAERRVRRAAVPFALGLAGVVQAYLWWRPDASATSDVLLALTGLAALVATARRAVRAAPGHRAAWIWSTVTAGLWALAYTQYAAASGWGVHTPAYPVPADAALMASGTAALVAVLVAPGQLFAAADRIRLLLDAIMICVALFGCAWVLILDDLYRATRGGQLGPAAVVYVAEAILVVSVVLLARATGTTANDIRIVMTGFAVAAVTGVVLVGLTVQGSELAANGVDGGLALSALLLVAASVSAPHRVSPGAAAQPTPAESSRLSGRHASRGAAVLPYAPLLLAMAVGGWSQYHHHRMPLALISTGTVVIVAVLIRQYLMLRANAALAATLHGQTVRDPLTGLGNRVMLADSLQSLQRADNHDRHALLLVDLDGFKEVNDTLGHSSGDTLLVRVADELRRLVSGSDLVVRLGGDEFAVLVTADGPVLDRARALAQRVLDVLGQPFTVAERTVRIGASVGIALAGSTSGEAESPSGSTYGTLLRRADLAMYAAKNSGKHRYVVFAAPLAEQADADLNLRAELIEALHSNQFRLFLQPIVAVSDGRVRSVEALLRWQHPSRGLLSPGQFLPQAQRSNLLAEIDRWVIHAACAAVAVLTRCPEHHSDVDPDLAVGVNVHPGHVAGDWLVPTVSEALAESGVAGHRLLIEITEHAMVENLQHASDNLHALRARGVHIAVDDFGAGHGSLLHLTTLPIDTLKIDRSLVAHSTGPIIVEAITRLAHRLGLKVTAEGVETPVHLAAVTAAGCDNTQGYLLGRPEPTDRVCLCDRTLVAPRTLVPAAGR